MKFKTRLFTIVLIVAIDLIGFGMILPLLPFFAQEFGASPWVIGILYSVYSLCQLIFSPIWGGVSDRIGRRPVILLSTCGSALAYCIFAFAPSLAVLIFSRIAAGIMGGNISTAQAYVADITSHQDRAKGMGLIGAAFGVGFLVGPALTSLVLHPRLVGILPPLLQIHPYTLPGFLAALLSALSFFIALLSLPETVPVHRHAQYRTISIFTNRFWNLLFPTKSHDYVFPVLMGCVFLLSFGQSSLYGAFPLYCYEKMAMSARGVGGLFAFMGLIAIFIQGGFIRLLLKRFDEKRIFFCGCALMTAGLAGITFVGSQFTLMVVLGTMTAGGSLCTPTLFSMTSKASDPSRMGTTMGLSQGISGLGRVLGPAWGGLLYQFSIILPFLATSAIYSLSLVAAAYLKKKDLQSSNSTLSSKSSSRTSSPS